MQATITRLRANYLQGVAFKEGVTDMNTALLADAIKHVAACIAAGETRSYNTPSISFGPNVVIDIDAFDNGREWVVDFLNVAEGKYFAFVTVTMEGV
jgi:hypothetical protein